MYLQEVKIEGEKYQWNVIFHLAKHTYITVQLLFAFINSDASHPSLHRVYIKMDIWLSFKMTLHSSLHHADIQQKPAEKLFSWSQLYSCLIYCPITGILNYLEGEENVVLKQYIPASTPTFLCKSHTHNTENHFQVKGLHLEWWQLTKQLKRNYSMVLKIILPICSIKCFMIMR